MLSWGSIITISGIIIIYAYVQFRAVIEGPDIVIESPTEQLSTTTLIEIKGVAKNAKATTLQGRPIFIDTEGRFSEKLLLAEGYNIIVLTAADANGRTKRKAIEIVYENPDPVVPTAATSSAQVSTSTAPVIQ